VVAANLCFGGLVTSAGKTTFPSLLRRQGPPVMNEEERGTLVEAVKWVDEIVRGAASY
jgi:glycerol-3-phosphate cytidylyltransferase-like family protein